MPPPGTGRARTSWILILLVACALGLRLASVGRLLPQDREPDAFEVYEMQRVQHDPALVKGVNFEQRYPWLLAWTLAALPAAHAPQDVSAAQAEERHLATAAHPFVRVRLAVALLATLQVLLTFFLARRFVSERQALLAVFLVGTSLLQLLFSVEARPHGAHAGLALLALIAALQLVEDFGWVRLALAVLTSAAAIATLQLGPSTLPPLFVACLLLRGRRRGLRVALALGAPLAALLLARPWYTSPLSVDAQGIHLASQEGGGHTLSFGVMDFLGSWRGAQMLFEHDPVLALLAGGGILLALAHVRSAWRAAGAATRRALAVASAFALPYALVITVQGEVYERFLMPLLPFLALLGALCAGWIWKLQRARALVLLALGFAALSALQFARLALVPDTFEQAAAWIRRNVDPQSKVVLFPDDSLPLLYSRESVAAQMQDLSARNVPWVTYQATIAALPPGTRTWNVRCFPREMLRLGHAPDEAELRGWLSEEGVEYLVVEYSLHKWNLPVLPALERAASELGQLAFTSQGSAPDPLEQGPTEYQGIRHLALRELRQSALGPELRIWKITRR